MSDHQSVASLLGQPALVQLIDKVCASKTDQEKTELRTKAETQCKTFNGKGKLTVDDLYSVLKVQVLIMITILITNIQYLLADEDGPDKGRYQKDCC